MATVILPISPTKPQEFMEETVETNNSNANDHQLVIKCGPSSRYALEETVGTNISQDTDIITKLETDEQSTASSSTIPSLNDLDVEMDQMYNQDADSTSKYGGLHNMGNTCYLNSALQMLASLDNFRSLLNECNLKTTESKLRDLLLNVLERLERGETLRPTALKREIDEKTPLFIGYRQQDSHEFLTTLLDLIDEEYKKEENDKMEEDSRDETTSHNEKQTSILAQHEESGHKRQRLDEETLSLPTAQSFKDLKFDDIEYLLHGNRCLPSTPPETVERHEPKYKLVGGRMDTSGVSLTAWNDDQCVADEQKLMCKSSNDGDGSDDSTNNTERNPVDSTFTTEVRVCLTCDSCKYQRSHNETYTHLSLDIGQNCSSIDDGLRKFFETEQREIKCEKCFCETATQTIEITRLPSAILLHLKRFIVDVSPDYSTISYRKDQSPVLFEEELNFGENDVLGDYLANDISLPDGDCYSIRSIVNHIGSSAGCGHYSTDSKRHYDSEREWTRFNDEYVSKITSEEATQKSSQTAYMIMYEIQRKQD